MLAQGGQRPVSSVLSFRGRNSPPLLVPGAVPRLPRIISSGGSYGSACSSRGGSCPCLEILCPGEIKNVGPRLRRILTGKALTDVRHLGWAACPGAMCSPAEALKFFAPFSDTARRKALKKGYSGRNISLLFRYKGRLFYIRAADRLLRSFLKNGQKLCVERKIP